MFTSLCRMRGLSVVQAAALRSRCVAEGGGADAGVEADAEADPLAAVLSVVPKTMNGCASVGQMTWTVSGFCDGLSPPRERM